MYALILLTDFGSTIASAAPVPDEEAEAIAVEAYLYLYPLVTMDLTRRQMTDPRFDSPMVGPPNTFVHLRSYPTVDMRTVVRPNFDTLYSSAWLDLAREPMIVSVPDTHGRYFLLPMLDLWTDVFAVPGKRTTGTEAGDYAVVPPGWAGDLPDGVERIDAPTSQVWILGRTQTNGPDDYDAVHAIQDGYTITPLSRWGKAPGPEPDWKPEAGVDLSRTPKEQVDAMTGEAFFAYAAEVLRSTPTHLTDWSQVARLWRLGFVPGEGYDPSFLSATVRDAVKAAPEEAQRQMATGTRRLGQIVDGWSMNTSTMGVYGDDYLWRAIVAQNGLGANQPEDAVYPLALTDSDGRRLEGGTPYRLHFDANALPPVDAFWSVTMYDAEGYPVPNALDRYALGDRDPLKYNPDGSLDLWIQSRDPGDAKRANWLPSPGSGALGITMRLYAPRPEVLNGGWAPPPIERTSVARR